MARLVAPLATQSLTGAAYGVRGAVAKAVLAQVFDWAS